LGILAHPIHYRHLTRHNGMYGACSIIHNNLKEHGQAIAPAWKFWPAQFLTGTSPGTMACTGHVP